jgi:RHH-type rel operon transcriptional repressor/antitoxin RelB
MNQASQHGITLSVRVPAELREQLDDLAEATGRTKSFLALEALRNYLDTQAWQVQAIEMAIEKADNGKAKFADHEKVVIWLNSWGTKNKVKPPKCK